MATESTQTVQPEPQSCRVCMKLTADGEQVPNLDGRIFMCRACVRERRRLLDTRAERIRSGVYR